MRLIPQRFSKFLAFCFMAGMYSIGPSISEGADGHRQTGKPRSLLAADYEKKIVAQINPDNSIAWQKEIRDIHDAQPLPDGHWLLQTAFANVMEIDRQGKEVWRYDAGKNDKGEQVEIHAFRRLPNGRTMIAESGKQRIIEVDKAGKIVHTIALQVDHPHPHRDTRLVRPTPEGTYLVAHEGDAKVREYDSTGKVVWSYDIGTKVYSGRSTQEWQYAFRHRRWSQRCGSRPGQEDCLGGQGEGSTWRSIGMGHHGRPIAQREHLDCQLPCWSGESSDFGSELRQEGCLELSRL